jgi:hypothetical protein
MQLKPLPMRKLYTLQMHKLKTLQIFKAGLLSNVPTKVSVNALNLHNRGTLWPRYCGHMSRGALEPRSTGPRTRCKYKKFQEKSLKTA